VCRSLILADKSLECCHTVLLSQLASFCCCCHIRLPHKHISIPLALSLGEEMQGSKIASEQLKWRQEHKLCTLKLSINLKKIKLRERMRICGREKIQIVNGSNQFRDRILQVLV